MSACPCFIKLQAVVLDPGLDDDLISDVQKYLEDLLNSGLRQRLLSLIKVNILIMLSIISVFLYEGTFTCSNYYFVVIVCFEY